MQHRKRLALAVLALSLGVTGCASTVVMARLYPLSGVDPVEMTLAFDGQESGAAYATLPSGEVCEGEFVLWASREGDLRDEPIWGSLKSLYREGGSPEWSEVYGFGGGADAGPVGTAVLSDGRGTTLEVVFYHATRDYYLRGDGLARDSSGRWYRVMLGPEPDGLEG